MLPPNPVPLANNAAEEEEAEDSVAVAVAGVVAVASVVAVETVEAMHNVVALGSMVQILAAGMAVIRVVGMAQTLVFEAESMRLPLADLVNRQVKADNSRISAARHRSAVRIPVIDRKESNVPRFRCDPQRKTGCEPFRTRPHAQTRFRGPFVAAFRTYRTTLVCDRRQAGMTVVTRGSATCRSPATLSVSITASSTSATAPTSLPTTGTQDITVTGTATGALGSVRTPEILWVRSLDTGLGTMEAMAAAGD